MTAAIRNSKSIPAKFLFPFAIILLLVMSLLLLWRIDNMRSAADQVNKTNLVRLSFSNLVAMLKNAEANQRGFLLTKDSSFFYYYTENNRKISSQLDYIHQLLQDNPPQSEQAKHLTFLVNKRLLAMDHVLSNYKNNDQPISEEIRKDLRPGIVAMQAVERQVQKMVGVEQKLLREHTERNNKNILATPVYTIILTLLALLIIIIIFDKLNRQLKLSKGYLQQHETTQDNLKKINTLFEYAEEAASVGSWKWQADKNEIMHTANLLRLFGYEPGSPKPDMEKFLTLLLKEEPNEKAQQADLDPQKKTETIHEFWYTRKDGKPRYFRSIGRFFLDEKGQRTGMGTVQDITEEYLMKQQIEQRSELTEALVESSVSMIAVIDKDMRYLVWNRASEIRFGLTKEEVIGQNLLDMFPFVREDMRLGYIKAGLNGQPTYKKELPYVNGQRIAEFSYIPLKSADGKILGLLIMIHDVTERIQTAAELKRLNAELQQKINALKNSEAFNRHITDMAPNAIYVIDIKSFTNVYVNKQVLETHGYSEEEIAMMGSSWLKNIFYPEDLPTIIQNHKKLQNAKDEDIIDFEYRIRNKNGDRRHLFTREAVFKRNGKGEVDQVIGVAVDITDLKKAQEKLIQLNKELTDRNMELQHSNEELASFNYIASHDLQEPLRKIQTFSNFIEEREEGLTQAGRSYLKRMQLAAGRMRSLIKDLLAFSRAREVKEELAPVDLNETLQNAQFTLKAAIDEKEAIIKSDRLPVVSGIAFQLQQLFENLVGNAIKYSKQNKTPFLSITCELVKPENLPPKRLQTDHSYYRISFRDNGIGFEQEYAERVFELFQRLHSKDEYSGTGIGLAICKKIAQNHGGTIVAKSQPEKGSTFEVYLPTLKNNNGQLAMGK